jgi:HPt (histidine-containing phosphotransfer) domain-containing protein
VDLDGFRAIMREAGVEEVVDATIDIYLAEAPGLFAALDGAVTNGVPEDVRRTAHSLKSASGNIRATRFPGLLQAAENLGRDGDMEGARTAFDELRAEYRRVIDFLQASRGGS